MDLEPTPAEAPAQAASRTIGPSLPAVCTTKFRGDFIRWSPLSRRLPAARDDDCGFGVAAIHQDDGDAATTSGYGCQHGLALLVGVASLARRVVALAVWRNHASGRPQTMAAKRWNSRRSPMHIATPDT